MGSDRIELNLCCIISSVESESADRVRRISTAENSTEIPVLRMLHLKRALLNFSGRKERGSLILF